MLWLAGLMGLMAVGAVTFVDPQLTADDDDDTDAGAAPEIDQREQSGIFEADYDPRGGDDTAVLPPLETSEDARVVLSDGTDDPDRISGADDNDRARGRAGADTLTGGGGNDELRGDQGNDVLAGDSGNDTLHGHDGTDALDGGSDHDVLVGHNADDTMHGGVGDDSLQGSDGRDVLHGGDGTDTLQGGLDDDTLSGGMGSDVIFGGWGNDALSGLMRGANGSDADSSDFLNGGGGEDDILVGNGDVVTAGDGADRIMLGDWLRGGAPTEITDYTAVDDSLVLVWDDSGTDPVEPQVGVLADPEQEGQTLVLLDGEVVALINGTDIAAGDIALIPLSSASHFGLEEV